MHCYLLQIDRVDLAFCDRCSKAEAAGFVLSDAAGVTKFFCGRCVVALIEGCLPAIGDSRQQMVEAGSP